MHTIITDNTEQLRPGTWVGVVVGGGGDGAQQTIDWLANFALISSCKSTIPENIGTLGNMSNL